MALLTRLIELGVRDVVVCPGSRSQALALAAAEAEAAGAIHLHVRIDERSASFLALGIARETGVPAPVIVTSGTAVANLMPAVLEAHEGRVPFLALTADRPEELRGVRASQTTRQAAMFGRFARFEADVDAGVDGTSVDPFSLATAAVEAARGRFGGAPAGPVQVNVAFREPLSGWPEGTTLDLGAGAKRAADLFRDAAAAANAHQHAALGEGADTAVPAASAGGDTPAEIADTADRAGDTVYTHDGDALAVVIAGEGARLEAEAFARAAGLPLLAEVVSGSRFGREAITNYATLIDDPAVGQLTERAIVFGHPTLTRQVSSLLQRDDVDTVVVDPHTDTDHVNPGGRARVVRAAEVAPSYNARGMRRWLGAWIAADRALIAAREQADIDPAATRGADYKELAAIARAEVARRREPVTREHLAEQVWRGTWPHDRLVLAASRLVRVLDRVATARRLTVHANRGLAGIDGTVATALGIATTSQRGEQPTSAASITRVLIGDLALLHDVGSLLIPPGEPRPRVQLFVGNDGGGTMFDLLEAAESAKPEAFERVMFTPQNVGLEHLAAAYGWTYHRVSNRGELAEQFTSPVTGPTLVEVTLARTDAA